MLFKNISHDKSNYTDIRNTYNYTTLLCLKNDYQKAVHSTNFLVYKGGLVESFFPPVPSNEICISVHKFIIYNLYLCFCIRHIWYSWNLIDLVKIILGLVYLFIYLFFGKEGRAGVLGGSWLPKEYPHRCQRICELHQSTPWLLFHTS